QDCCRLVLPPLLAKVDNAHERHSLFIYPLSQCNQPIFSNCSVVITLEGRRGASHDRDTLLSLRSHDRHVTRVISRGLFLFVCRLVFFVDNDESQVFQRREDRASGTDYDTRSPTMNFMPFVVTFAFR